MRRTFKDALTGHLLSALVLTAACTTAGAADPAVDYLDTQIAPWDGKTVTIQGSVEIASGQQKWFPVYFQLRLDAKTPLTIGANEGFLAYWGALFPPSNVARATYDDIRIGLPKEKIEEATNLPKGQRTLVWAICDVWDSQAKKYVGTGWDVRAPLLLTTDQNGKIVNVERFPTWRARPNVSDAQMKIKVLAAAIQTTHATLRQSVKIYKAHNVKGGVHHILVAGNYQGRLRSLSRGYFFSKIDTPQKALELVLISRGESILIKTPGQYIAIATALKTAGWKPPHLMEKPSVLGVDVTEEPGLGYRVRASIIRYNYSLRILRDVELIQARVTYDGAIGEEITTLIKAPELPYGVPPGWTQPLPKGPVEYDKLVSTALTDTGSQRLPEYVKATDQAATIPCARGENPDLYSDPSKPKP
jgi:hypothetical protein